jgi:hypothetical protein
MQHLELASILTTHSHPSPSNSSKYSSVEKMPLVLFPTHLKTYVQVQSVEKKHFFYLCAASSREYPPTNKVILLYARTYDFLPLTLSLYPPGP